MQNHARSCGFARTWRNYEVLYWAWGDRMERERMLTVREAARLQSFDDRYRFFGSQYSQFKQVGNSVPVLMAATVAMAMEPAVQASIRAERSRLRSASA